MLIRVAVYIPPHTIGALCLIWLSSVNIDSTIVPINHYTVSNEIIKSHRNRTVHVYNCKK